MSDAHGGLDLVHVLSAFAAGPEGVDLQLVLRNHEFAFVFDFRNHVHAGKAGVPAFVRIERRDADQPVHAPFGLAKAIGVFALDQQRDALDAGDFARECVRHFHLPPAPLAPALVHAQEHVRPVARFGAAGPGVDAEDAVVFVVRAAEQYREFQRVEVLRKFGEVEFE